MNTTNDSGVNFFLWSIPKPNWQEWERKHKAKLWQAVALLCGLDPARLESPKNPGKRETIFVSVKPPEEFSDYLDQAKISISAGLLKPHHRDPKNQEDSEIDLTAFTSWANASGLAFPDGYPWRPEMNVEATGWPWGRYDTKHLRIMARAIDRFWKNYDPNDPTTAPKNGQLIGWLEKEGVSSHIAKVMATILRADGLPTRTKNNT